MKTEAKSSDRLEAAAIAYVHSIQPGAGKTDRKFLNRRRELIAAAVAYAKETAA